MTATNDEPLDDAILAILRERPGEVSPDDLEAALTARLGGPADTFAVRRAIWRLSMQKKLIVTMSRRIRGVEAAP
jgi:hypothetical protein